MAGIHVTPAWSKATLSLGRVSIVVLAPFSVGALADAANAQRRDVQCNFHQLSLYPWLYAAASPWRRHLFCLLTGTLTNRHHEPWFLRQSLLNCLAGDLGDLLLDIELIGGSCDDPANIRPRDADLLFRRCHRALMYRASAPGHPADGFGVRTAPHLAGGGLKRGPPGTAGLLTIDTNAISVCDAAHAASRTQGSHY